MSHLNNDLCLYEQIGGALAIHAAVDEFYKRILDDTLIARFFSGVSMLRRKAHQFAFLSQAHGGPRQHSGASMQQACQPLSIEQHHFDAAATHLVETLHSLAPPQDVVDRVVAATARLSTQVVNSPSFASTY